MKNNISNIKLYILILLSMIIMLIFSYQEIFATQTNDIRINEVCADADENCALHRAYDNVAEDGYYDWIELYNCSDNAISLNGYYLTNKNTKLTKYALPDISLPAHGFIVIYAGDEPASPKTGEYFTGFSISKKSEDIYLTDGENIIDSININKASTNMSISRYPDGGDEINEVEATPKSANKRFIKEPTFSHESGFFDNPFYLSISSDADDVNIYYTTDGTEPTTKSKKYTGEFEITDATPNANKNSARKDTSPYLYIGIKNTIAEIGDKYKVPSGKVNKSNIIRAICIDKNGYKSKIATSEYFVLDRERYKEIPVLSIIAKDEDLFGFESGIYVLGEKFSNLNLQKMYVKNPASWDANYQNDTEIKAIITKYDISAGSNVSETADIKIKGASTRALPQKSFYIKADTLDCQLSCGGNDDFYKLNDAITSEIAKGLNVEQTEYEPCQVFINGEYWGMYHIGDRLFTKKHYADKYNVSKDSIAIIKKNLLNEGTQEDLKDWNDIRNFASKNNMSDDANFEMVAGKVDIDSMIDYFIIEMFINNMDWPGNNIAVWRSSELDGKWKYILYDTNIHNIFNGVDNDMFKQAMNRDVLFKALYANAGFKSQFNTRLEELLSTTLAPSVTVPIAESIEMSQKPYVKYNAGRFFQGIDFGLYDAKCNRINTFLSERGDKLKAFVENYVPGSNTGGGGGGGLPAGDSEQQPSKETSASASSDASAESTKPEPTKIKAPTIKKLTAGKKSFAITWKKVAGVDGYKLQYSRTKTFKKGTRKTITISNKRTNYTVRKLKPGKKYYVRMRCYKVVDGKKRYSSWTDKRIISMKLKNRL